jgi:acetyl-CoA C-acetyltransferase
VTSGWPELDGLWDYFTHQSMGALTEIANARHGGVGRAEQDAFAAASHTKAAKAWKDSLFADEVVPVSVPQRRGEPLIVTKDEGIRTDVTAASLAGLRPSFRTDGTITAGSPSQLSDGAAAVAVTSQQNAEKLGLTWLAQIGSHASVADPTAPCNCNPSGQSKRPAPEAECSQPTWTWWRSTRPSRLSASSAPVNSAWTPRGSM